MDVKVKSMQQSQRVQYQQWPLDTDLHSKNVNFTHEILTQYILMHSVEQVTDTRYKLPLSKSNSIILINTA